MTRNISRCLGAASAVAVFGSATLAPVAGCQSGGLGGLLGSSSAMDMLSPVVKDAANSYLTNLTSLTSSLGSLKDLQGVMDFVKKIEPMVQQLSSSYETLAATTGAERSNLLEAFGPKIESANAAFLGQTEVVKGNGMWSQVLSPMLDQVKLFQ